MDLPAALFPPVCILSDSESHQNIPLTCEFPMSIHILCLGSLAILITLPVTQPMHLFPLLLPTPASFSCLGQKCWLYSAFQTSLVLYKIIHQVGLEPYCWPGPLTRPSNLLFNQLLRDSSKEESKLFSIHTVFHGGNLFCEKFRCDFCIPKLFVAFPSTQPTIEISMSVVRV